MNDERQTMNDIGDTKTARSHRPQALPLDILYEDDHLLAVNKQPGIVVHPAYKHPDGSVFNALLWHLQETGVHPHLLQRLDRQTSGVMLVSKSAAAHARVIRAMRLPPPAGLRKEYLAVVHGVPEPPTGEIRCRLGRDPADTRRVVVSETEGKDSTTRYARLSCSPAGDLSLVHCELVTGRMHQVRVHLASRGWPIVGDDVYAALPPRACHGMTRQALHAWRVSLPHPITNAPLVITAPIPEDMARLLAETGLDTGETPVPLGR
jgi:23S rRNA pseudouridine1911/1915/1917 synthase